ncbi:hypothetical protein NX722_17780 [Endozoicomonas gorgoniicola]|uniref:Uncharacterized protein n=1 Tax=Endozoicomonas gorgoniicola TaxID=1234144 RepID=A0ABT3MYH3_9GAMM|nr:hypothetical protein [Endozoicomonas gorgoniicola]MCW7554438.1 hypothetical protein [Endozoicomonas gorgoniicola]
MTQEPSGIFNSTVTLYRKLNKPELKNNSFSCELRADAELCKLLGAFLSNPGPANTSGEVRFIAVDGIEYIEGYSELPDLEPGTKIELEFDLPSGEAHFYASAREYADDAYSLKSGEPASNAYIVDLDYLSGEANPPGEVQKLNNVSKLIQMLRDLAHFQGSDHPSGHLQMGFVVRGKNDNAYEPFDLTTEFNSQVLDHPLLDLELLEDILNREGSIKAHAEERKNIFRFSIAEVLSRRPGRNKNICDLVQAWEEVIDCYEKNFEIYISDFSFSRVTQELADKQVELSKKLGGVLNDISGKVLTIPVSLAAVGPLINQEDLLSAAILTFGALLLSIFLSLLTSNQKIQFSMVCDSVRMVLKSFHTQTQADSLNKEITKVRESLAKQMFRIGVYIQLIRFSAWLPAITAALIFFYKFS